MSDLIKILLSFVFAPIMLISAFFIFRFTFQTIGINPEPVISIMIALTPLWLPLLMFHLMFDRWKEYVYLKFILFTGRTTLRIKIPQEIFKSPEAMENVLAQIHNVNSQDNLWQTYIDGKRPMFYSFEIVSIGGDLRLYVNVPTKKIKNAVEVQLYAHYPGIEVVEEPIDYTNEIVWDPDKWEMIPFHMGQKEDQVFPIKTYIDFGMDKLPKEEQKFEPMASMLELMGSIKPHERLWVQFMCRSHAKQTFKTGFLHEKKTWEGEIFAKIDEMMGRGKDKRGPAELENQPRLTTGERDTIAAMERHAGKYAYETGIRWYYITKKGKFDGNLIAPFLRTFAQYDVIKRNGIGAKWRADFDYNWFSDWSGKRKLKWKEQELFDFKRRWYEQRITTHTNNDALQIMTVEEIATMFHIPSSIVTTPGLSRIPSTRKEAPPNLPTAPIEAN
jgi:hypothetical protein